MNFLQKAILKHLLDGGMIMKNEFSVILVEDEDNCAVKKVSQNTFDQINNMLEEDEDPMGIVESIVELHSTEENIIANGLSKEEAIEYAEDISENYVIIEVY
jgi:hypothetical protein